MIVGRARELAELERLVAEVRAGRGGALVLHGEAGIGKTTLLRELAQRYSGEVTLLRAAGVEAEAEIAFSALSDLLGPATGALAALPAAQAAALGAAIAIAPPRPGDRLAVCVATLGLLRAASRVCPVLALVDDVQWLDAPSRECILYAARRVDGPAGFVLALRDQADDEPAPGDTGLSALRLAPLGWENSLAVLGNAAPGLPPPVARTLAKAAAGNPLALMELPATLSGDQRLGLTRVDPPLAPGGRLQAAFAHRIAGLSGRARRALLIAAAYRDDDLATIAAACAQMAVPVRLLAEAEAHGLARLAGERLVFGHPLIRGAVYRGAPAAQRRAAHRALAAVLVGEPRAWHLAAAAIGPDESAAAELEAAAGAAAARRGYATAAVAMERAARLSSSQPALARRLLAAGQAAGAAGLAQRALALLTDAVAAADGGELLARIEHARGLTMGWSGSVEPAAELLASQAGHAAVTDPVLAATMMADAAGACTAANRYHRAQDLAEQAVALLGDEGGPPARARVLTNLGWALLLRGDAARATPVLAQAQRLAAGLDPLAPGNQWLNFLLRARVVAGEFEQALAESLAVAGRARDAGALATLGGALVVAADAAYRLGDWELADACTAEAIAVSRDTGQVIYHGYALSIRARLTAARGLEEEATHLAGEALSLAESSNIVTGLRFGHAALGFLHLGLGRASEAIAALETVERLLAGSGLAEATLVPWAPDLVEAYTRAGRADDAGRVLAMLARQAATAGTVPVNALLARCRGLLDSDFGPPLAQALALDDQRPMPFERARALLTLGRRLHRARRRVEARDRLREALAGFERLGAEPWAAQARSELRAAGGRRRRAHDDSLTPQELRVAAAVARGASNREIAAELFVTLKTVEFHLGQLHRKLGAGSRAQLVATLASQPAILSPLEGDAPPGGGPPGGGRRAGGHQPGGD